MQAQKKPPTDTVIAAPTANRTPRVGIILSSFKGGEDHFGGAKFASLPEPQPVNAELTDAQIRAMTLRAVELGAPAQRGLRGLVDDGDQVVLLASRYAEPAVVAAMAEFLKQNRSRAQVTILSPDPKKFPGAVDPATAEPVQMPAPGIWSRRDITYRVPKVFFNSDRVISIAPLRLEGGRPSLAIDNYRWLAPAPPATAKMSADTTAIELFGFHPAEFAVLGGVRVLRNGQTMRHNVVIAGASAPAVDSVGSMILGLKAEAIPLLQLAGKRGFGDLEPEMIWMRGNEIDEARLK